MTFHECSWNTLVQIIESNSTYNNALIRLIEHRNDIKCFDVRLLGLMSQWIDRKFLLHVLLMESSRQCSNEYGGSHVLLWMHRFVVIIAVTGLFGFLVYMMFAVAKALMFEILSIVKHVISTLLMAFAEIWRALLVLGHVIMSACHEIWLHCSKENVSSLVAVGIILYAFPEVYNVLMELLKKNVVVWVSHAKLKG